MGALYIILSPILKGEQSFVKFSKDRFSCPLQKKVEFSFNHRLTLSASVTFKSKINKLTNSY